MIWLIAIITAYLLLAVVALIDRYLLAGQPDPKVYAFYVGLLSLSLLLIIPFIDFYIPNLFLLGLSFLAGATLIIALFSLYTALEKFEASRIITATGGLIPIFSFILVWALPGGEKVLSLTVVISFMLLVLGSVVITWQRKALFGESLKLSVLVAIFFALSMYLSKQVYNLVPFLNGLILIRVSSFLVALFFLFSKETRQEIFQKQETFSKSTGSLFMVNQAMGGAAVILQNWSIALASISFLPIIHALQGLEYGFLFVLAVLFSSKFPRLLKKDLTKKVIIKKVAGIMLIGIGLAVLAL
ncbi:MAG: hypothetical protein V5A57_00790 [Candidatus Paceibacterota bacterium]